MKIEKFMDDSFSRYANSSFEAIKVEQLNGFGAGPYCPYDPGSFTLSVHLTSQIADGGYPECVPMLGIEVDNLGPILFRSN